MYLPEKSETKFYINIINILYNNRYIFDNFIVKNVRNAGAVAHIYLQLTTLLCLFLNIVESDLTIKLIFNTSQNFRTGKVEFTNWNSWMPFLGMLSLFLKLLNHFLDKLNLYVFWFVCWYASLNCLKRRWLPKLNRQQ